MRPQFVCHQHSHSHSHSHFYKPTDVSRLDRYRCPYPYPKMVRPGPDLSSTVAASGFNRTPLTELSADTKRQLSSMLNRKKVLHSEEGYERDWRGIANLVGVIGYINADVKSPMDFVLQTWIQHKPETAAVGNLEKYLGIIDRWDVRDDIQENLVKDTDRYNTKQQQLEKLTRCSPPPEGAFVEKNNNDIIKQPSNILTLEDQIYEQRGLPLPRYNACVLYAEADIGRATDIMDKLQSYNYKLFLKDRDLLTGVAFEHVQLSEFMANRCNHLIVVLTNAFLRSPENTYLVNFTQKLQIEKNQRKIIPILYEEIVIPPNLAIYTKLNYANQTELYNFWERLAKSLYTIDAANVYTPPQTTYQPMASEAIALPETPRIMITEAEDEPDWKAKEERVKVKAAPSTPPVELLPEKKTKKNTLIERLKYSTSPRNSRPAKQLAHAQSFNAINKPDHDDKLNASMSNLSTYSEKKKRFNKFSSKLLKTFTRSSTKLQTPC